MIKELSSVSLLDILPSNILEDEKVNAAARALDEELQKITAAVQEVLFLPYLDTLPEKVLDLLAWQWHVDFYEPVGMDPETKRKLIKESIAWHRMKGTPAAVERVVSAVFDTSWIKEWYEYGGETYFFKVITENATTDREEIERMKRAIESTKNVRSWLERIEFILHLESEYPEIWDELARNMTAVLSLADYVPYSGDKRRTYDGTYCYGGNPALYDGARLYDGAYHYDGGAGAAIRYDSESGEIRLKIGLRGLEDNFAVLARYNGSHLYNGLGVYGERASPEDEDGGLTVAKIRRYDGRRRYDGGDRNLADGSLSYDGAANYTGGDVLRYSRAYFTDRISGAKSFRKLEKRAPWSERHPEFEETIDAPGETLISSAILAGFEENAARFGVLADGSMKADGGALYGDTRAPFDGGGFITIRRVGKYNGRERYGITGAAAYDGGRYDGSQKAKEAKSYDEIRGPSARL